MSMNKNELLNAINNLPLDQLRRVSELVGKMRESESKLDENALSYVFENFDETLEGLVER